MIGTLLVGAARLLRSQPCTLILAVAIMLIIVQAESKVDTGKRQTMKDEQVQVEQLATKDAPVIVLNEDNWRHMLKDEWMVEFYAPWCPACKSLAPIWERFGKSLLDLQVNVAKVDVTTSTSLSGRFFVTALPTIYHVKNGEFRHYRGLRDYEALMFFIKQKQWTKLDPVPIWKRPDTIHMSVLSYVFKLSHTLKEFNVILQQEYGLPSWGAYALFAVGTIFVGAILGLTLVCLIDLLYPPKKTQRQSYAQGGKKRNESGVEDLANDELVDDANDNDNNNDEPRLNADGKLEIDGLESSVDVDDIDDEDDGDGEDNDEMEKKKKKEAVLTAAGGGEGRKGDQEGVFDDAEDSVHTSDGEKNSRSESDELPEETDLKTTGNRDDGYTMMLGEKTANPGEVRKRKPRKAD